MHALSTSRALVRKRHFANVILLSFCHALFVFSYFSFYVHSDQNESFNVYSSTCLLSMLTHTLERKYMFLICNLILAFLATTTSSSSDSVYSQYSQPSNDDLSYSTNKPDPDLVADIQEECDEVVVVQVMKKEEEIYEQVSEEGRDDEAPIEEEEEVEEGMDDIDELVTTLATKEEEEEEELGDINTEELNRKFEEFIRKMKEEIRIEP